MSETKEPVLFFPDNAASGGLVDGKAFIDYDGYRRAPEGWLKEAVERVYRLCFEIAKPMDWIADRDEIRAAILGDTEQEPEAWEVDAARAWIGDHPGMGEARKNLARHFAKARREAQKP